MASPSDPSAPHMTRRHNNPMSFTRPLASRVHPFGTIQPQSQDVHALTTVFLELPVPVIQRTDGPGLEPSRDAMEVERVLEAG